MWGRLQNGQDIAIARSSAIGYSKLMNEASILVKLEHENLIDFLDIAMTEQRCTSSMSVHLMQLWLA
ncbi:hypothetical protein Hdeb2414_s0002g00045581 [Helianthus debilis subsp. tardiflorus]